MAVYLIWFKKKEIERQEMDLCDNLTYVGLAFMTLGMLSGAIWAKAAWGHYWAWDPKETWAAATWFSYLGYVHYVWDVLWHIARHWSGYLYLSCYYKCAGMVSIICLQHKERVYIRII